RRLRVAIVLDREVPNACADAVDLLPLEPLEREQAPVVDDLRDEPAHLGVHSPRALEKESPVGRHGRIVAEQMLEHRATRSTRVDALRYLRELKRIAKQNDVVRRRTDRECVGERHLARLVDYKDVEFGIELLACEKPCGPGEETHLPVAERGELVLVLDPGSLILRVRVASRALLQRADRAGRYFDFVEQIVDRLVRRRDNTHALP